MELGEFVDARVPVEDVIECRAPAVCQIRPLKRARRCRRDAVGLQVDGVRASCPGPSDVDEVLILIEQYDCRFFSITSGPLLVWSPRALRIAEGTPPTKPLRAFERPSAAGRASARARARLCRSPRSRSDGPRPSPTPDPLLLRLSRFEQGPGSGVPQSGPVRADAPRYRVNRHHVDGRSAELRLVHRRGLSAGIGALHLGSGIGIGIGKISRPSTNESAISYSTSLWSICTPRPASFGRTCKNPCSTGTG